MQCKKPYFSIITPSYNQGEFILRTVKSVLTQCFPDLEYLVYDGGSTDNTLEILESLGSSVRWRSEPDHGQAHAVNKGLIAARGEVFGWVNSDDIYYPGSLQAVHDFFQENPYVEILYGMADHIDENDNIIEPYYNEPWDYDRLKRVCYICQPAVFFRRSIVEKYGMLEEALRYCMDYEYWLRIGKETPMFFLKRKLAGSRLHGSTKTIGSSISVHEEIIRMLKEKIGEVPDSWIFAHAHVMARSIGLPENDASDFRFMRKVIAVSLWDSLRVRHYIPVSMLKEIIGWLAAALKSKKG